MKRNLAKTALVIAMCGSLLAGCTGQTNTEVEPTASPSQTETPTATPAPTEIPSSSPTPEQTISPVQEELSSQQIEYVELLAKYLHQPVEEMSALTQDPYWVWFLLDYTWTTGQENGTLSMSEASGTYGEVLIPMEQLEQTALQLFATSVDQEYIKSLYTSSEDGAVIYYPSGRPFFMAEVVQQEVAEGMVKATVEVLPAGDGGAGQTATILTYQFVLSSDNILQLTSITNGSYLIK